MDKRIRAQPILTLPIATFPRSSTAFRKRAVWAAALLAIALGPPACREARGAERDLVDYSQIEVLRWAGPGQPGTYKDYLAGQPRGPIKIIAVEGVAAAQAPAALPPEGRKVLLIVNSALLPQIQVKLNRYVTDAQSRGYTPAVFACTQGTAEELKAFIKGEAPDLIGCVLFGSIPCAWYEVLNDYNMYGYASFPCDLFLADLDGTWEDRNSNAPMQAGVYDAHSAGSGDEGPEIFIGRIDASRMGGNEASLINAYLDKLHGYYGGLVPQSNFALTYTDDSWAASPEFQTAIADAYPSNDPIKAPATSRDDYRDNRLASAGYEFIQLACHSSSYNHEFTRGGGFNSLGVKAVPPQALLYNLFCCSACRYTDWDQLGGAYIFNSSPRSLAVVGSTKTGAMLVFGEFYRPLSERKCVGQALKEWFRALAPYSESEVFWHLGMTVIGDPLVTMKNRPPVAEGQDVQAAEDWELFLTLPATDPDYGATLTFEIVDQPRHGTLTGAPPCVTYTPSQDHFSATDSFTFKASDGFLESNVATVSITLIAMADTPSVTNAATNEDTQSTSGLVISRNPADGEEVTHFKITGIANGTLYQNDGTTAINNGDFITFAQGNAGLKFTPAPHFIGSGSFMVQASTSAADEGLGGETVSATITVNAAAASSLLVSGFASPAAAGAAGTVTVTAQDAQGNTVPGYSGTVSFASTDAQAVLPGDYPFVSGDNGSHSFTLILKSVGTQSITATDTATGSITGTQSGITVNPGPLAKFALALSSPQTNGVAFTGANTLTAQDAYGNTVTTFDASADQVRITANAPLVGDVYRLGTGNNNVLNRATDFVAGVADLTALGIIFVGNYATGTFTATSATGKNGTSGSVTINGPGPGQPGKDMQVVVWLTIPASVSIAWGAGTTGKTADEVTPLDWTVKDAGGDQLARSETCVSRDANNNIAIRLENTSNTGTKAKVSAAVVNTGGWNIGSAPAMDTFVIQAQLGGNALATLTAAAQELTGTARLAPGADQELVLTVVTPTDITRDVGVEKTMFVVLTATPE